MTFKGTPAHAAAAPHDGKSALQACLDVFRLTPSEHLSANEIEAASQVTLGGFNAQQQPKIEWPATSAVARAYLDQLARTKGIAADRAAAVKSALERADGIKTSRDRGAADAAAPLERLAGQIEADAAGATGRDAARLRGLAATLKGRAAALKG